MAFQIKAVETREYHRYETIPLQEISDDVAKAIEEIVEAVEVSPNQKFTIELDSAETAEKTWAEFLSYAKQRPDGPVKLVRNKGTKANPVDPSVLEFRLYLPEPEAA